MTTVEDLCSAVTSGYAALECPSWPDPWPGREPDVDAYSRLTDPDRYEILFRRAELWLAELAGVPGISVQTLDDPGVSVRNGDAFARGWRVRSDRPGAGSLLVLERDDPMPVVAFALDEPEAVLAEQPDCGCDACDGGSDSLLRVVDELFAEVLTSPVVVLLGTDDQWRARWSRNHREAGGSPGTPRPFRELMSLCERIAAGDEVALPAGTRVWTSQPWLGAQAPPPETR